MTTFNDSLIGESNVPVRIGMAADEMGGLGGIDTHIDLHPAAVIDGIGAYGGRGGPAGPRSGAGQRQVRPDRRLRGRDCPCCRQPEVPQRERGGDPGPAVVRKSAVKARIQTINQIRTLIVTSTRQWSC
ncbi:hypothetical protein IAG44_33935 [Streptomyces roseirectus]|uniref:Uncharacterized protein n=1 Tax=Streptomyces roseirectus TaxID=2768066 RepID=A0A7H0IMF3_9ACTN|nr:hypothetical protein [Streptomyces roseirectus]QNP73969.1 hypothetical protein IAG44_33935 [Streptomyces roseirectus]